MSETSAEERQRRLLRSTAETIARRGASETRLIDVATDAGVSIGALQHHFRSRDELLVAALRDVANNFYAEALDVVRGESDPARRLRALVDWAIGEDDQDGILLLEFLREAIRNPALREAADELESRWVALVAETIADGVATGRLDPVAPADDMADQLVSLIEGLSLRTLVGGPGMSHERAQTLVDAFITANVRPQPGGGERESGS